MKNLTVILLIFCLLLCRCNNDTSPTSNEPKISPNAALPNIVLVMADDLGYGDLTCYGQKIIETPNIDDMASEGMRFLNMYAGSSVGAPSKGSLLTGLHTGHATIRKNRDLTPKGQFPLPDSTTTISSLLKKNGYQTGFVGKWNLGGPKTIGTPWRHGFDYFFGFHCNRDAHHHYPTTLYRNRDEVNFPENGPHATPKDLYLHDNMNWKRETYSEDLFAEEALSYIEKNKEKPFFLMVSFATPHASSDPPVESMKSYEDKFPESAVLSGHYHNQQKPKAAFAGSVSRLDSYVGQIDSILKKIDLSDETLFIFTSDNGAHNEGGHDPAFFNSSGGYKGLKRTMYEGGLKVPFIVKWPGKIRTNTTSNYLGAFWDVLPTICDVAEIKTPSFTDGISITPTLFETGKQGQHNYLYWEMNDEGGIQVYREDEWKFILSNIFFAERKRELYNLKDDPYEENNLVDKSPGQAQLMEAQLNKSRYPSIDFPMRMGR